MKILKIPQGRTTYLSAVAILVAVMIVPARSGEPRDEESLAVSQVQNTNPEFIFGAYLSSADSVQNITGTYASNLPPNNLFSGLNPYDATIAADQKGKLLAQGTIDGVTNADGTAAQLDARGTMKTQKGSSLASFQTSEKKIFYEDLPAKVTGNATLDLSETNVQILKAQGGGQQGTGKAANKGRGTYAFGKRGATNEEFVNAPTNNTAGGKPWDCYFQVYRNEFGHYFATNVFLTYYTYSTNTGSVQPVQTSFSPEWVTFSEKDSSYSVNFYKPIDGDLRAKWSVKKMIPFPTNNPKGTVSYKFLGQGGSSAVSDFTSYNIQTNVHSVSITEPTNGLPPDFQ